MSVEIECPRCHRLDFGFGDAGERVFCSECHWPIRPRPFVGDAYGYDVLIEVRTGMVGTATEVRYYKGNEATARRRVRVVPGYVRVLAVLPLGEAQWLNSYGEGRM